MRDHLNTWAQTIVESDTQFEALHAIVGATPESPLVLSIANMQMAYTKAVAALVGDKAEWLEWYWLENGMGAKCGEAGPSDDMRPIVTIDDLAWLLGIGIEPT